MGCSLETKVIEDLENRGLYESDIHRVTNLEKFKRLNDIWTAESVKRYNLSSPLKMFNIVEGTPKKIIQGSSYRRDNIVTTHRAFVNKDFFKELQEKYDLANQPADTTVNRLELKNNISDNIKLEEKKLLGFNVTEDKKGLDFYTGSFKKQGEDKQYTISKNGIAKYRFRIFFTGSNNIAYISDILKLDKNDKTINASEILPFIIEQSKKVSKEYGVDYELYLDPIISENGIKFRNSLEKQGLIEKNNFTFTKWKEDFDKNKYIYDDSYLYKIKQNNTKIELNTDFDVDKLSNDLNLETNCN